MLKFNQNGFSVVEGLLLFVIVTIIGVIGYFVYNAKQNADTTLGNAAKSSQGQPLSARTKAKNAQSNKVSAFKFNELGVQFTLPDSLKGLSYNIEKLPNEQGVKEDVLYLDDSALATVMNKCVASVGGTNTSQTVNFAAISRTEGKYDAKVEQGESGLLMQFDGFHIIVGYPNGAICGSHDESLNQE